MKILSRILFFLSIFALYLIFKELAELYLLARSLHPLAGYLTLSGLLAFSVYFIFIPIFKIIKIPKNYGPTYDRRRAPELIERRLQRFRENPFLRSTNFDFASLSPGEAGYRQVISTLEKESERIRKRYVLQLFYSSSISQNGFLDAILILSSSVNLVRELFVLFHGRVSNKDLLAIARQVYLSMAIGGSEGVEYATQELFSKFATEGFRSVPFADKIFGSLADGFVNAALLTRISLITENYCKLVLIQSQKDLFPSAEFIFKTTKFITGDIVEKMTVELLRMSRDKTVDYVKMAVNPVAHLFSVSVGKVVEGTSKVAAYQKDMFRDVGKMANRPILYGLHKLTKLFKRGV